MQHLKVGGGFNSGLVQNFGDNDIMTFLFQNIDTKSSVITDWNVLCIEYPNIPAEHC